MYSVSGNKAYIYGSNGSYDNKVADNNVRYGRNSVSNNMHYLSDYTQPTVTLPDSRYLTNARNEQEYNAAFKAMDSALIQMDENHKKMPPLGFEQRYTPYSTGLNDFDNQMALMGASYEEMGQRTEMSVQELTGRLQTAFGSGVSANALDLNHDQKIDLSEYATSIALADTLSDDAKNGVITNKGQNASLAYANTKNYDIAYKTYASIHQSYNLSYAQAMFLSNPNNLTH